MVARPPRGRLLMDTRENSNRPVEVADKRRPPERETAKVPKARLREGGRWYPSLES